MTVLELFTGATALVSGLLLAARPDGSLLQAQGSALAGSPFSDWRLPGILLATLVGGGFLLAAGCELRRSSYRHVLSMASGLGLVAFEVVELGWLGFQPLQAVCAAIGCAIAALAWRIDHG